MRQVVLITGGTTGIGLAEAFLARRSQVAVCARSREPLDAFTSAYPQALAVRADITDAPAREGVLDAVADRFGRLDVLIDNAGVFLERDLLDGTEGLDPEIALNSRSAARRAHDRQTRDRQVLARLHRRSR